MGIDAYASVRVRSSGHLEEFSNLIGGYEENVTDGSLVIVDFAPFYVAAMSDDLEPFEQAGKQIKEEAKKRNFHHSCGFDQADCS